MATRKQRRRREKEKRHEYEIVEIDEEGNETVLDSADLKASNGDPRKKEPVKAKKSPARGGRKQRVVQPPSWPRVMRRGLLFSPVFLATVYLLGGGSITIVGAVLQTVLLLAVFVPFSYVMDRFVWRSYQKRLAKGGRS